MAKLKGKSKKEEAAAAAAAATDGSANAKEASDDDTPMDNPAPSSGPVEEICKEAAAENTAVLDDKSDGAEDNDKEEETEPEEIEGEGVEEETEDGLDARLEEDSDDDVEEDNDGLDDNNSEEDSDDDDEVDDNSDEGDELEEDDKEENGVVVPVGTDVVPEGGKMVDNYAEVEGEMKAEEEKDDKKDDLKVEDTPSKKPEGTWMKEKKTASASVAAAAAISDDAGKTPGNTVKQRAAAVEELKLVYGMGMIFMCNARTKKDCFRYNVLGLPESKKDMVAKIYKGMRLFLFDLDLKVLYGVYKAASPGGYNIEPEAFKAADAFMTEYPAQVRFKVIKDCPPLPVSKFKEAIQENYYGKYKFDSQLSPEQVKRLCKLFQKAGKDPRTKTSSEYLTANLPRPARGRGKPPRAARGRGKPWKAFGEEPEPPRPARGRGRGKPWKAFGEEPEPPRPARGRGKNRKAFIEEPELPRAARGRGKNKKAFRGEPEHTSSAQGHPKERTIPARGRKRTREATRAEPEQIPSRGRKKFRGRRDDSSSSPSSGERHRYAREDSSSPRGGDRSYAKRRDVYRSPPPRGPIALPPPHPAYAYGLRGELRGDEYYYRRDPPPPQLLNPRDYGRDLPRDYHAYGSMYREPIPYHYAAPPAAGLAPSAYAPPAASFAPSAYAPPAARLAPSAYAPSAASLAPSAYAPPAQSLGPTTGFPPSAASSGPTTGFPPSASLYYRY